MVQYFSKLMVHYIQEAFNPDSEKTLQCPCCIDSFFYNHLESIWIGRGNDDGDPIINWIRVFGDMRTEFVQIPTFMPTRCREAAVCLIFNCENSGKYWAKAFSFHKGQYAEYNNIIFDPNELKQGEIKTITYNQEMIRQKSAMAQK